MTKPIGRALAALAAGLGLAASAGLSAHAADVTPGTVLSKANIDQLKDQTFEGHKIGDLLTDRMEWEIRQQNLAITLKASTKPVLPLDPRELEATKKFSGGVKLDPSTNMISGYVAGTPFPNIDPNDPNAAEKVVWNYYYNIPDGDQFFCPFAFVLTDGRSGVERVQEWNLQRYFMLGRVSTGDQHTMGDGSIHVKALLFASSPQDVKGLGTYSIRYATGQLDDIWAYIRSVRRIRRLSGGAWVDPIGGTDQLQDDLGSWNAHPSWYKGYKLLGKRWILAVANSQNPVAWNRQGQSYAEQFPRMDHTTAPYWQPLDTWEPRPVWTVEASPPDYHPYSKKVLNFDQYTNLSLYGESYDKKGEFWKVFNFAQRLWDAQDGYIDPATGKPPSQTYAHWGIIADYQRLHATTFKVATECVFNPPGYGPDDISLTALEAKGR